VFLLSSALLLGAGVVPSCLVPDADMAASRCTGLSCSSTEGDSNAANVRGSLAGADASAPDTEPAKPACGSVGSCLPEDVTACSDYVPPAPAGGNPSGETSGGADGGGLDSDAGGVPADAGAVDAGSVADAGGDPGNRPPAVDGSFDRPRQPEPAAREYACRLTLDDARVVGRGCAPSGVRGLDDSCTSSLDCLPGLGCVGEALSGRCRPFCCAIDGDESCGAGSYCAERPLRAESLGETTGPLVPVCVRADGCSLGERFPCTGRACVCGPDTACALVRPDGTTACLVPGTGGAGDACSLQGTGEAGRCRAGYLCSQAADSGTCVKTCDLDDPTSGDCRAPSVCQAAPALPMGWGTCVGAAPEETGNDRY
jgi:hypothetical protein